MGDHGYETNEIEKYTSDPKMQRLGSSSVAMVEAAMAEAAVVEVTMVEVTMVEVALD